MSDHRPPKRGPLTYLRGNLLPIVIVVLGIALVTAALAIADPVVAVITGLLLLAGVALAHWLRHRPLQAGDRHGIGSTLLSGIVGGLAVLLLMQLVPYGRDHSTPPVTAEPAWDSPTTRELAVRACFDCHSNEVTWPWYSNVAPISWAVQRHVDEGRHELNFSEWNRPQDEADEAAETVIEGEMPPLYYTITHPDARLTDAEKQQLIDGLTATLGRDD